MLGLVAGCCVFAFISVNKVSEEEAIAKQKKQHFIDNKFRPGPEIASAFNSSEAHDDERELNAIQKLIDALAAASEAEDQRAFHRHVNFDRMFEEFAFRLDIASYDHAEYRLAFTPDTVDIPNGWSKYRIVKVAPGAESNERLVFVLFEVEEEEYSFCLEIIKDPRWKLFDYCNLETGFVKSEMEATLYDEKIDERRWERDTAEYQSVLDINEEINSGDYDEADLKIRLDKLDFRNCLTILKPIMAHQLGNAYAFIGEEDKAMEIFTAASSEKAPVLLYDQAWLHYDLGEYEKSLAACLRFESLLGFNSRVAQIKLNSLDALGREAEAYELRKKLVQSRPSDNRELMNLVEMMPTASYGRIADIVKASSEPELAVSWLADSAVSWSDRPLLRTLQEIQTEIDPNSFQVSKVKACLAYLNGEDDLAFSILKEQYKKLTGDDRDSCLYEIIDLCLETFEPSKIYRDLPNPREVFFLLAEGYEYDEAYVDRGELDDLLNIHRQREPNDPWLHYYLGVVAAEDHQWQIALKEYESASKLAKLQNLEVFIEPTAEITIAQFHLGNFMQGFGNLEPNEAARIVVERFINDEELRNIIEIAQKKFTDKKTPWFHFFSAVDQLYENLDENRIPRSIAGDEKAKNNITGTLNRGYSLVEEFDKHSYTRWCVGILLKVGMTPEEIYAKLLNNENTFRQLMYQLNSLSDRKLLADFLTHHHKHEVGESRSGFHRLLQLHFEDGNWRKVVEMATPWPQEFNEPNHGFQIRRSAGYLYNSFVELGRLEEAEAFARQRSENAEDNRFLVATFARTKKVRELNRFLETSVDSIGSIYNSKFGNTFLTDPLFAEIRNAHPPSVYEVDQAGVRLDLLFARNQDISVETVKSATRLMKALSNSQPVNSKVTEVFSNETYQVYRIQIEDREFQLVYGLKPKSGFDQSPITPAQRAIVQHKCWLTVDTFQDDFKSSQAALQLIAAFVNRDCLGYHDGEFITSSESRTMQLLNGSNSFTNGMWSNNNQEDRTYVYLNTEPEQSKEELRARRLQDVKVAELLRNENFDLKKSSLRILVSFEQGSAAEQIWMNVVEVDDARMPTFTAVSEENASIVPVKVGDRFTVETWEIKEFEIAGSRTPN